MGAFWVSAVVHLICTHSPFFFLALFPCHAHPPHHALESALWVYGIYSSIVYFILEIKITKVLEGKWMKLSSCQVFLSFFRVSIAWGRLAVLCLLSQEGIICVCVFLYLVLNKHFLCFHFLRILNSLIILLFIIT